MDSTGESLHKRGYRIQPIDAPLNEVLAAGLIKLSNWHPDQPLYDPMCGSGTIIIEALKIGLNIPPQDRERSYLFMNWKNFNNERYHSILSDCFDNQLDDRDIGIKAADKSIKAVNATKINLQEAGLDKYVTIERRDFFKTENIPPATIITNPPYDQRLQVDDVKRFYKLLGDQLKKECKDCSAWIFSGNIDALKSVGLKPNMKYSLYNGGIESKFYNFNIYEGSLEEE